MVLECVLSIAAVAAALPAPYALSINGEASEQLAAVAPYRLGWAVPPAVAQQYFTVLMKQATDDGSEVIVGEVACNTTKLDCSLSDNIDLEALLGTQLSAGMTYTVAVTVVTPPGAHTASSVPFRFSTALPTPWPHLAAPVWGASALQNLVLLRGSGFTVQHGSQYLLYITAKGVPMRQKQGGANASKLLGAYALWVNGLPVSTGPGRPTGTNSTIQNPAQVYDTVDVTALLRPGEENVIAVQGFYWNNAQEAAENPLTTVQVDADAGDVGGIMALLRAGGVVATATGGNNNHWQAYRYGDEALLPAVAPPGCDDCCPHAAPGTCHKCNSTGGRFQLMHEHWNMSAYPENWRLPGFVPAPDAWTTPMPRAVPFSRLAPKQARAIALVRRKPKAVWAVTRSGEGSFRCSTRELNKPVCLAQSTTGFTEPPQSNAVSPASYCYVVDMGSVIQGGINVTFSNAGSGHEVSVVAAELMEGMNGHRPWSGSVQRNGTDESIHYDRWTLRAGRQSVASHEYIVARYWEVINAPEPPSDSVIEGWHAWYPYDAPADAGNVQSALTQIATSSATLDAVWELCRDTGRIGAMDVNTDSNARQRDNCNVDSHVQALHQAAAAPTTSAPYRLRNAAFMLQPDAAVHPWTEFKTFTLGAVHAYTLDTGDISLAHDTYDTLAQYYSVTQFIQPLGTGNATEGLVVKEPLHGLPPGTPTQAADDKDLYFKVYQDLVDWPNSADTLNNNTVFPEGAKCCKDDYVMSSVNTAINAHAAQAERRLADMARWIGRPASEADRHDARADGIAAGLQKQLITTDCPPPASVCFADGLALQDGTASRINHTAVHGTLFVVGCGLLEPAEALRFLPFLKAKTRVMPLFSIMASEFFLSGLYHMATADPSGEASDFAFEFLTRSGRRSWLEMIEHNATMTIEHWFGVALHSWSHPWSAAPGHIIPQWLLGVRPLERAWRRIAVHPQPGSTLTSANMTVPSPRGNIVVSYTRERGQNFALDVTVPGNTNAEVCLPIALLPPARGVSINDTAVTAMVPPGRPGQLCLSDLPGGHYRIRTH